MVRDLLPPTVVAMPKVARLRNMINYGDDRKPLGPSFWKHFQGFRELYKSSSHVSGSSFFRWNELEHMKGLDEMVNAYLDNDGNGARFWPDDENAPEHNALRYSVDKKFIQATIVQLFFRLNLQQYQNQKYKENRERRSSTESRGGQITLDEASTSWSVRVDPSHRPASQPRVSLSAEPRFNSELPQERVVSDLINPSLLTQSKGNSPQDPYVVPESPRATLEAGQSSFQSKVNTGVGTTKKRRATETGRAAKRQKEGVTTKKKPLSRWSAKSNASPQAHVFRNPPRTRKKRQPFGWGATAEEIDAALRSRSPTPTGPEPTREGPEVENTITGEPGNNFIAPSLPDSQERQRWVSPLATGDPLDAGSEDPIEQGSALPKSPQVESDAADSRPSIAVSPSAAYLVSLRVPPAAGPQLELQEDHPRPPYDIPIPDSGAKMSPLPSEFSSGRQSAPVAMMSPTVSDVYETFPRMTREASLTSAENLLNEVEQTIRLNRQEGPSEDEVPQVPYQEEAQPPMAGHVTPERHLPNGSENGRSISPKPSSPVVKKRAPSCEYHDKSECPLFPEQPMHKAAATTTAGAPKMQCTFIIILSRRPWKQREWKPQGKFLKKTLPQLKKELPPGFAEDAEGLMFRLGGPGVSTEQPVFHGEDMQFDSMRRYFGMQIKKSMDKHTEGETLSFRIEIEALQHDFIAEDNDEEELF